MIGYPEFAEVDGKRYKINTDFKYAIRCEEISQDKTIGDYERTLAIIYILFGDEGLNDVYNHNELIKYAIKYLSCNKDLSDNENNKVDMDYIEDYPYIKASFRSDYGINLDKETMHWWEFYDLLCGLSNSELGNCCILNRIRNLRNYDVSKIQDDKMREDIIKSQEKFALKKYKKENNLTSEEEESMRLFNEQAGI